MINQFNAFDTRNTIKKILIYLKHKVSTAEYQQKINNIKKHIQARCINFTTNQSAMIDSLTERKHRRVIIDRIFYRIENGQQELVTDPKKIKTLIKDYF